MRTRAARLAFVLNLDAEHELEAGSGWTAPRALRDKLDSVARSIRLPEGATLVTPETRLPPGFEARLWCPTPRALAMARAAGATLATSTPSLDVVRSVNERGFAARLADPDELEGTAIARTEQEVERAIARPGPTGRYRLKRGFGASGRGQRSVAHGALAPEDRAWVLRALRHAPLYVEPEIAIERELAVYGWARRDRGVELTGIRGQTTDARGQFVRCARIDPDGCAGFARPLLETAERTGYALLSAGYQGPFGIDAYLYRSARGALRLRALSEINARYCMGWDERDGF